jgi:hypothetical protein
MSSLGSSITRRVKAVFFASFSLVLVGMGAWSCVGEGELEAVPCPNKAVFVANVSPYLERRCGMLDCHGQPTRPMRIYGQLGLRLQDPLNPMVKNVSGGAATTPEELEANYAAVCNLDPEAMQDVVEKLGAPADKLLLVQKARGLERHKGGKVVNPQDEGDRCILDWLKFRDDATVGPSCAAAVARLK